MSTSKNLQNSELKEWLAERIKQSNLAMEEMNALTSWLTDGADWEDDRRDSLTAEQARELLTWLQGRMGDAFLADSERHQLLEWLTERIGSQT